MSQIDLSYQKPSKEILDLVEAPLPPLVRMNTAGTTALLLYRHVYQSITALSEKEMRLAGLRINPITNAPSRQRSYFTFTIKDIVNNKEFTINGLPENGQFNNFSWSYDELKVAFSNTTTEGVELWLLDLEKKSVKKLSDATINANIGSPFMWMKDDKQLLVRFLPTDKQPLIDTASSIPTGPTVSVNDGQKAQNRTYQDLLKNKVDEFNFDQLAHSELYLVDLEGQKKLWKEKAIYKSIYPSPDGNYFLISTIERPYSYLVPYNRFPFKTIIYDKEGNAVKTILKVPLIEDLPKGFMAVRTGMRNVFWRSDQPSSIYWNEALDGGDPANSVDYRDAVYTLAAPFKNRKKLLLKTQNRFSFINWGNDKVAIAHDRWWNTRNRKTYLFNPSNNQQSPKILFDRNYQDIYNDPGSFVSKENEYSRNVLDINDDFVYLIGQGYSEDGVRPFIDRFNYKTLETNRLYQADDINQRERLIAAMDVQKGIYLTRLESKSDYPNYQFRNVLTGELTPITAFKNPFAAMQEVYKEVIKYERPDGV